MNVHIALYKWKPSVAQNEIDNALATVESLADKVPEIVEIGTGLNVSKYSNGYTHVILVRANSKEAIDAYRNHPDHVKIASAIDLMEEHSIGVDFETHPQ